ncbi:MAG TPA: C25 family cysteine peptidase, partial [Ignavibacteria bacterium]
MRFLGYKSNSPSFLRNLLLGLVAAIIIFSMNNVSAQVVKFGAGDIGVKANILESRGDKIKIEYLFGGYEQQVIKINGTEYLYLEAPGMVWTMEKGIPQIPIYRSSIVIPDLAAMNYRITEQEAFEVSTMPIIPSKGHMTRDIDINSVPYTFSNSYNSGSYYPENTIKLEEPYIVRDLRGMTIQFNPMQYNSEAGKMKIYKRIVIELFSDNSLPVINPFNRQFPLTRVSSEFTSIYRGLFLNYGIGGTRFDSIPEPGRMLVIYPASYAAAMTPFIQWKTTRGLTVLTAEYPAQTGSGSVAIKTYIQNLYNTSEKITYIVLAGDVADIPTLNGVYESAPSDPCYVKLAGTDAYPDAFISRISCQSSTSISYVVQKLIKFERDIDFEASWYNKGAGIGGPDVGGSPSYADSIRMNWVRDTLMAYGFTQVDKINGPIATPQTLINSLNDGRYILNYIGHGSGTSWSNTGFSVTNAYQLNNGWKNPFLIDVACLNGNFTLNECLAEALLRAGDTANPKGCCSIYASSTNASWVPPCDMQTWAIYTFSHQYKKTAGAISFFGVMKAMDLWGGSSGEGLKLMEQYNIFGDCSLLLTRGVPLGPSITHNPLSNTENLSGPYVINATVMPANSGLLPGRTKLFWTRTTAFDSVVMTNSGGNNWIANIPGNGSPAIYKYYIATCDSMNRAATAPAGAPTSFYSFQAMPDIINPVITHTALGNQPKTTWPALVLATVTDNIGVDSVWVKWYNKNNPGLGIKQFKLNNTGGSAYSASFNSTQADVQFNDSIFYRVFARDSSSNHNTDSTVLYGFKIINLTTIIVGTGTTSSNFPFTTYWKDGRTQYLYLASDLAGMGSAASITKIGFDVISVGGPAMTGFKVSFQNTTLTSLTGWVTSGWTVAYNPTSYAPSGTGWNMITMTTPFNYTGGNLLIDICYNNTTWTAYSPVNCTATSGMYWGRYNDLTDPLGGCDYTAWTLTTGPVGRANTQFEFTTPVGVSNLTTGIPNSYSLSQNYPNPFNPATQVKYDLPKEGFVTLKVYDVLGREVSKLVNEVKTPGSYIVDFDGTSFSSGVYFYKLEVNGFSDV